MENDAQLSADTKETKERSLTPPVIMCYAIAYNMIFQRTEPILPLTRMSTIRGSDGFVNRQSNRKTAQEATEEATAYDANNLNQYTAIQTGEEAAFVPTFDAGGKAPDGCKGDWTNAQHLPEGRGAEGRLRVNQTKVKTSTGIRNVVYNAENRPVTFTSEDGTTVVECTYDYMGRRHTRKITVNGSVTIDLRYIYRGYLQIAAINPEAGSAQWFILWDPTQPIATRPLGIRKDGTWYTYGWDLTKNICESARRPRLGRLRQQAVRAIGQTRSVCPAGARSREAAPSQVFGSDGYIKTAYTYTPYGSVTANGNVTQPIQWSSEYNDSELGLVYYNYRHYNPADGRWTGRDLNQNEVRRPYVYARNQSVFLGDEIGLEEFMFNEASCLVSIEFKFEVDLVSSISFRYTDGESRRYKGEAWDEQRKSDYIAQVIGMIEGYWNGGHKLLPDKPSCPCYQKGIEIRFRMKEGRYFFPDINIVVVRANGAYDQVGGARPREYNSFWSGVHLRTNSDLRIVNHELGHAIGLDHPGKGIKKPNVPQECKEWNPLDYEPVGPNEASEYAHTGLDVQGREVHYLDLMGFGLNKRDFYFDIAKNYMNKKYSKDSCPCKYTVKL